MAESLNDNESGETPRNAGGPDEWNALMTDYRDMLHSEAKARGNKTALLKRVEDTGFDKKAFKFCATLLGQDEAVQESFVAALLKGMKYSGIGAQLDLFENIDTDELDAAVDEMETAA